MQPSHIVTNKRKAREHLNMTTALLFDAAEAVEEWDRYDLGNALRAMALDFDRGGEITTAPKRRLPGQPSLFVANRRRARIDDKEQHPMTAAARWRCQADRRATR